MSAAHLKTIRPGVPKGGRCGVAMGVSGLRLASQQPLCVQGCHPSPSSALPRGAGSDQTSGRWVRGTRYRVASSRKSARMEVTVWSALHVPGSVSGMTHHLQCSRPMLDGRCPELGYRRKVVSSHLTTMETTRAVKAPRPWPLG